MATLSLYIFNLLPLPLLDGLHFIRTILQTVRNQDSIVADEYDLEALELPREQQTRSRRSNQSASVIVKVTTGLFGCCIVLEIMNIVL
jgi:S2P endopeptidase